jgi:hypothetical protein
MQVSYDTLYTTIFPTYTVEQLIQYRQEFNNYVNQNRDKLDQDDLNDVYSFDDHLGGAILSKKYKLYELTDEDLWKINEENYKEQRSMQKCEDAVSASNEDNKRGFYATWSQLEDEMEGISFEVSRRKFFEKRSNE